MGPQTWERRPSLRQGDDSHGLRAVRACVRVCVCVVGWGGEEGAEGEINDELGEKWSWIYSDRPWAYNCHDINHFLTEEFTS